MIIGILPASGLATRLSGLPKFLLPVTPDLNLIQWHIGNLLEVVDRVVISTRPENAILFRGFLSEWGDSVSLVILETQTMSETVKKVMNSFLAEKYLVAMPDTFMTGPNPYLRLKAEALRTGASTVLAAWEVDASQKGQVGQVKINSSGQVVEIVDKDESCEFKHLWGALIFKSDFIKNIDEQTPHVGFAIREALSKNQEILAVQFDGLYFDCGTPTQYQKLLRRMLQTGGS